MLPSIALCAVGFVVMLTCDTTVSTALLLVIFAVVLAFEIAGVICILTIIGIVVVPFIIIYIHLVSVNLMAQFANISDKNNSLECNKEQGEHNES